MAIRAMSIVTHTRANAVVSCYRLAAQFTDVLNWCLLVHVTAIQWDFIWGILIVMFSKNSESTNQRIARRPG